MQKTAISPFKWTGLPIGREVSREEVKGWGGGGQRVLGVKGMN